MLSGRFKLKISKSSEINIQSEKNATLTPTLCHSIIAEILAPAISFRYVSNQKKERPRN